MRRSVVAAAVALAIGAGLSLAPCPAILAAGTRDGESAGGSNSAGPEQVEVGIWDPVLTLSPGLESRRNSFSIILRSGQRRIRDFAKRHKWQRFTASPLVRKVAIYDDKEEFDLAAARLRRGSSARIPRTLVAAEKRGELALVSPDVYRELASEGIEMDSYEKLVAHELAHVLHGRILDGAQELAGPEWFSEGFAVYAAGQFEMLQQEPSHDEIVRVVQGAERGNLRLDGAVVRYFARKIPLQDLVKRASQAGFRAWLLRIARAGNR